MPIVNDDGHPAGRAPLRLEYQRILQNGADIGWMKTIHRERKDNIVGIEGDIVTDPRTGQRKMQRKVVVREAGVLGIGTDHIVRAEIDQRRAMDAMRLDETLSDLRRRGIPIIAVVA